MKQNTSLERIIAKIDNDFNPDNSDWIARVPAWAIDAMSMLNCLRTETKRVKFPVKGGIVYGCSNVFKGQFKVYTEQGCRIKENIKTNICNCEEHNDMISPSTGDLMQTNSSGTTDFIYNPDAKEATVQAVSKNNIDVKDRYNYIELSNIPSKLNYVKIDDNKLELNFNTDFIIIESTAVATYKSDVYNCELPVIPDNGLLIEAIAYYCLYKMLCRGYKHPVFNLHASQYGTNPYYIWNELKDKAKRSVIKDEQGNLLDDDGIWRSSFFISTFNPRK